VSAERGFISYSPKLLVVVVKPLGSNVIFAPAIKEMSTELLTTPFREVVVFDGSKIVLFVL
jgi:hypothetical protein